MGCINEKMDQLSAAIDDPQAAAQAAAEEKATAMAEEKAEELADKAMEKAVEKVVEIVEEKGKWDDILAEVKDIKANYPDNLAMKHFDEKYFLSLKPEQQDILYKMVKTGIDNPTSGLGLYFMTPDDLTTFSKYTDKVIRDYHNASSSAKHVTDWDASKVGENGILDLQKLGLEKPLSMRVRVGRNLTQFNLPGLMSREERVEFEKVALDAFAKLQEMPEYGGNIYSMTPDFGNGEENPNLISAKKYQELVDAHIMFKDMAADKYLESAGIASDWPYGRGCYVSDDEQFIIWFGEEDHLRIMCMKGGYMLNEVFSRLHEGLQVVESIEGIEFATSKTYGYVTSCPSNLGTGMRASVHIALPNLTADGTDTKAKAIAKPLGLSVRGTGGEHTPIGSDGTVDISPSARLFLKESDVISKLYEGLSLLLEKEQEAGN